MRSTITLEIGVLKEGLNCYKIDTPNAVYYFDPIGCGFSSMLDKEGKDWINWNQQEAGAGKDRGIPNMGWKKFGHPGYGTIIDFPGGVSEVLEHTDDVLVIHSQSEDNKWDTSYFIYKDYVTQKINSIDESCGFWWQYEGTPGGTEPEWGNYFFGLSNGIQRKLTNDEKGTWNGTLENPEYCYYGSADSNRTLFFFHHHYQPSQNSKAITLRGYPPVDVSWGGGKLQMAVAGFGRSEPCCDTSVFFSKSGHQWSFGFLDTIEPEIINKNILSIIAE
jgi:hypothetical protein